MSAVNKSVTSMKDRQSTLKGSSLGMPSSETPNESDDSSHNQPSVRNLMGFIEKFDRAELQELLSSMTSNWLLSLEDFKMQIDHPCGLISQMAPTNDNHIVILVPYNEETPHFDLREFHQIIRELTIGIYALNQHPNLILDANFDESTSCQMPPAYLDTKLGQIMINTDYWLKALWHGAYFPREKRIKFSERWRQNLDIDANGIAQTKKPILNEFINAGLQDTSKDAEVSDIYDGDYLLETDINNFTEEEIKAESRFFMSCVDDIALQITFYLKSLKQYRNIYEFDADYILNSCVKATDERLDNIKYQRLKNKLNKQEEHLRKNFTRKAEIRRNLNVLKTVGFLVPLFTGLKRRMKIPDLNNMLASLTGDEVRTERELPPLILPPEFKCKTFNPDAIEAQPDETNANKYFNLHGGIQFELETVPLNTQCASDFEADYERIIRESSEALDAYLNTDSQQHYPVPVVEVGGKKYWSIKIDIENYHPQYPQKPYWVNKLTDDLGKLKPKRIPMTDINIYDLCKKYFGYKKATKLKTPQAGLKASAQRGLMGVFSSFARKTPAARLAKQDESGLNLMHYASIFNRPTVVTYLVQLGVDVNIKQQIEYLAVGPMPLHYAAKCGSLDTISCLVSNYANTNFSDHRGWAPIHYAAFYDNIAALKLLARKQEDTVELTTRGEHKWTPMLLAASSGALESIKCLLDLGANFAYADDKGYNLIHIAAHRFNTNVIEFFVKLNAAQLQPTTIIINMMKSSKEVDQQAAVRCLMNMTINNQQYSAQILEASGIEQLATILRVNTLNTLTENKEAPSQAHKTLICNSLSVLCNLSDNPQVRDKLSKINDVPDILMSCLEPYMSEDIQSRAAILLGDIALIDETKKETFASKGCFEKLIHLLDFDVEDLLVNTINAFEILCKNNKENQDNCAKLGILEHAVDLLSLNSDFVKAATAAAVAAVVEKNEENQNLALDCNLITVLVNLLKTRNVTVQLKIAMALEALATDNLINQDVILSLGAAEHMIHLLKIKTNTEDWSIIVREQAACTLWALAGSQKPKRKLIAEKIGTLQIIIMLLSKSEKLQYVGCKCVVALVLENINNQKLIAEENAIELLLKLLKSDKTSERVTLAVVETIAALCIDVAHVNNAEIQKELIEKGALGILLNILKDPPSKDIQIETAHAVACLLLGNSQISDELLEEKLDIQIILDLFDEDDKELRISAGKALSILAYNNSERQYEIKQCGGISYENYEDLVETDNEMHMCKACFQIVVLARVFHDRDQVWITALGISKLANLLLSPDDEVVIQTASYMASLSHTRAGITDAMIECGVIDTLCERVFSKNEQIRFASAVTLGYLTFNRTASRLLLHNCRNNTVLFDQLMSNLRPDSRITNEFISSYETALALGLPKLLVNNKVRFNEPSKAVSRNTVVRFQEDTKDDTRPETKTPNSLIANAKLELKSALMNRAQSAPINKKLFDSKSRTKTIESRPKTTHIKSTHRK